MEGDCFTQSNKIQGGILMIHPIGNYQGGYSKPEQKGITGVNSGWSEGFIALFQAAPTPRITAKDDSYFAISMKIMPLERRPINSPPVIAPMFRVQEPSFLKGMEDGVLKRALILWFPFD
jgi:hypothetical protein